MSSSEVAAAAAGANFIKSLPYYITNIYITCYRLLSSSEVSAAAADTHIHIP